MAGSLQEKKRKDREPPSKKYKKNRPKEERNNSTTAQHPYMHMYTYPLEHTKKGLFLNESIKHHEMETVRAATTAVVWDLGASL